VRNKLKVKILTVHEHGYYSNEFEDRLYELYETSDWDEVTYDELQTLQRWATDENQKYGNRLKYIIVSDQQFNVPKTIKQYLTKIKKQREIEEKARLEREEGIKKQVEESKKKTLQEKKKLLAQLKKEFGEN
jgi:hypothetical protein